MLAEKIVSSIGVARRGQVVNGFLYFQQELAADHGDAACQGHAAVFSQTIHLEWLAKCLRPTLTKRSQLNEVVIELLSDVQDCGTCSKIKFVTVMAPLKLHVPSQIGAVDPPIPRHRLASTSTRICTIIMMIVLVKVLFI
jgi:hypothetical protein